VKLVDRQRVACVLDDLPEMCEQAMRCHLTAVLADQPHNVDSPWTGPRAFDLVHAFQLIMEAVDGQR
jgi:hypothetical protein